MLPLHHTLNKQGEGFEPPPLLSKRKFCVAECTFNLVYPVGFEPTVPEAAGLQSARESCFPIGYNNLAITKGFEPSPSSVTGKCNTNYATLPKIYHDNILNVIVQKTWLLQQVTILCLSVISRA